MQLTFIGSGSAFTVGADNYHSNMLLTNDAGQTLLIDCGTDARLALYALGLSAHDIDSVYISHLHADHAGGLEWLGFSNKFHSGGHKPTMYISQKLVQPLWDHVLSGGMAFLDDQPADLSSYFEVKAVQDSFVWSGINFHLIPTIHTPTPSFGLQFNAKDKNVFITSDTQFAPERYREIYRASDLIFHDCETLAEPSGVHAQYRDLCSLDLEIKKKMWLYHYNPGPLPDPSRDGFLGFVHRGQSFDLK